MRAYGGGEGALLEREHLPLLCAVVTRAFGEDYHVRFILFGLQKFGMTYQPIFFECLISYSYLDDGGLEYLP